MNGKPEDSTPSTQAADVGAAASGHTGALRDPAARRSRLLLDSTDYATPDEGEAVFDEGQIREITALRTAHPELEGWSLERVSLAWASYSQDVHLAGYLAVPKTRDADFIAYLYGEQLKLIQHDAASCYEEVAVIRAKMEEAGLL